MDGHAENLDGELEILEMREAVGHANAAGEEVKARGVSFIEVADGAVRDYAPTAECQMDAGIHFAPISAARDLAEILNHGDFRAWRSFCIFPIIGARDTALGGRG